jgi:hypothetical protein
MGGMGRELLVCGKVYIGKQLKITTHTTVIGGKSYKLYLSFFSDSKRSITAFNQYCPFAKNGRA